MSRLFLSRLSWLLAILLCIYSNLSLSSNSHLYPGESLQTAGGKETLIKFIKGDPNQPLLIFVPGDSHLARIAYGYPEGRPEDFLSFWLHKKGYSFLGISYPLANPVYDKVYPDFTIEEWGQQIAEMADRLIKENQLPRKIVILGWSMGGSIEQTLTAAAKQRGLDVQLFIGLAAVPPLPYIMQSGPFDTSIIRPDQLADRRALFPWFIEQLKAQDQYNQHVIIPETLYLSQFIGHIPAAIAAEGYYHQQGKLIKDIPRTLKDSGVFAFQTTPWIALIVDDSPNDSKISVIDPASWNFLRSEMINKQYLQNHDLKAISMPKWHQLGDLIHSLDDQLRVQIHGNHFFFVGENGAKETAQAIDYLINKTNRIKKIIPILLEIEPQPSPKPDLEKSKSAPVH